MKFRRAADLPAEAASLRQALFLATGGGITIAGAWLLFATVREGGVTWLEVALIALFVVLFGQIAFGFSIALWGFLIRLRGEPFDIMRTIGDADPAAPAPLGSTAIVMPVYNEDPARVFRALENMLVSLRATGRAGAFDFFILSDSNQPDNWIDEECAWVSLCSRLRAYGRVFYRKRRVSLNGKSGNVADFCRRWGRRYRYLVILDADSVMAGETFVRLARAMDANPQVGLIQTGPQIVRGASAFQRLLQFSTHTLGPIFASGSNFWHLGGANYWGHNAIIRLQPFMEHCVLPELPGRSAAARHILSHDTVEAALMQQAGYQVWFACGEPGSYEEGPPNLTESLKRDRRWCQGNLQHFWFLFAPKTGFTNRIHIFFGLMAYLSAPLLVLFIALSAVDFYWKQKYAIFSAQLSLAADTWWTSQLLLLLTLVLLFASKFFGLLHTLPRARQFGGVAALLASSLLEAVASVLLAPILLYFYTKFVVLTLLGLKVSWKTQNRGDSAIPLGQALREYGILPVLGILVTAATLHWAPVLTLWLSPILAGWVLAVPFVMLTSSARAGRWLRRRKLLLIPEEIETPDILRTLDEAPPALVRPETLAEVPHYGLLQALLAPFANAVHISLLRRSHVRAKHREAYLDMLSDRLLADGPKALNRRETMAVLWSADALARLHCRLWRAAETELHPWWRRAMHYYNESVSARRAP
ncbi:MAG: glucans biosynthesis glucosyltransferase MdoH [Terrimicrobiaceae bacterium]|nr:glucans biosynthesis glucosyltransferase MdoH [Terrimicrobiaceae bacterium]